jgi:hypothetical protein
MSPGPSTVRLIDNIRKRRILTHLMKWIGSFLEGGSTQFRFNGVTSQSILTPAETPQRSPLSPILYMYYNGDFLNMPNCYAYCHSLGFIDDIAYGIQGQTEGTWRCHAECWKKRKYLWPESILCPASISGEDDLWFGLCPGSICGHGLVCGRVVAFVWV